MKYAVEIGLDVVKYIPSFIKIGLAIRKVMGDTQTHKQGDIISPLLTFFPK
jgi:hypothetical protein